MSDRCVICGAPVEFRCTCEFPRTGSPEQERWWKPDLVQVLLIVAVFGVLWGVMRCL